VRGREDELCVDQRSGANQFVTVRLVDDQLGQEEAVGVGGGDAQRYRSEEVCEGFGRVKRSKLRT
jgi:hypothetical protein